MIDKTSPLLDFYNMGSIGLFVAIDERMNGTRHSNGQ